MNDVKDKIAVIYGAGGEIGSAVARQDACSRINQK